MVRSRQLAEASCYMQPRQANERLSFACKLANGIRYYMYGEKWGSRYDYIDLRGYTSQWSHPTVHQNTKDFALTVEWFQSAPQEETKK